MSKYGEIKTNIFLDNSQSSDVNDSCEPGANEPLSDRLNEEDQEVPPEKSDDDEENNWEDVYARDDFHNDEGPPHLHNNDEYRKLGLDIKLFEGTDVP
jgi:hypothetical protein